MSADRLLIVYNAEAGLIAGARDSLHKLLSPATYPCSLCALTHGTLRMDPVWKRFLARMPFETRVYHRPDFRARYPDLDVDLPALLLKQAGSLSVLVGADELGTIDNVETLIQNIERRLR